MKTLLTNTITVNQSKSWNIINALVRESIKKLVLKEVVYETGLSRVRQIVDHIKGTNRPTFGLWNARPADLTTAQLLGCQRVISEDKHW